MIGDRELLGFRQGYYDLLVGLLWREPPDELIAGLARGLDERIPAARALQPLLGDGWDTLRGFFAETPAGARGEAVRDEYTRLFVGPGAPEMTVYECHYLTGRLLDRPLAALRATLGELGIAKDPAYPEPEDFLAFELEAMRCLVRRQADARDPDGEVQAVNAQAMFLKRHLLVWGRAAARDLASARAPFYAGVGGLLQGFLALEHDLLATWGPEELVSLAAARGRFAGIPDFSGTLFDQPGAEPADRRRKGRSRPPREQPSQ